MQERAIDDDSLRSPPPSLLRPSIMPPKRTNPLDHPPPDSSSGDRDETTSGSGDEDESQPAITQTPIQNKVSDSESGDESSDDDEEQTQTPTPLPKIQTLSQQSPPSIPKSPIQNNGAGSESGEKSESVSANEDDESEKLKQPSKPVVSSAPKKDAPFRNSGPSIEAYRTPIKSAAVNGGLGGSDGKKLFQRVWNEDDEVAVLEGMIEYKTKGSDPVDDLFAFRDSIQGRLHFDCTVGQLREKVNRMRRNFQKQYTKNQNKVFPDPQAQKVFDLSKRVWGGTSNGAVTPNGKAVKGSARDVKSTARGKKVEVETDRRVVKEDSKGGGKMDIDVETPSGSRKRLRYGGNYDGADVEDFVMEVGLSFLTVEKRAELEKKWKKLKMAELKLYAKRQKLRKEQSDLIMAE